MEERQKFPTIRIVNLHYDDTVETDVYRALRERIHLFTQFVGKLQPILAQLPRRIADATFASRTAKEERRAALVSDLQAEVSQAEKSAFDLDAIAAADLEAPPRPTPPYGLPDLDRLLRTPAALPPGIEVKPLDRGAYRYASPGMPEPIRVTASAAFFDEHPESMELWSPGSPLFPNPDDVASEADARTAGSLRAVLKAFDGATGGSSAGG